MSRSLLLALLIGCGGSDPAASKPVEKPAPEVAKATPKPEGPKAPPGHTGFAEPKIPFTTAYPEGTMSHLVACTDAGCEVTFQAKAEGSTQSRVVFQLPAGKKSADELYNELVSGPTGLFAKHSSWKKGAESGGNTAQPWLRKVVSFEDGKDAVGRLMVGEASSGAFLITERLAPAELEKVRPAIAALYANLQVK